MKSMQTIRKYTAQGSLAALLVLTMSAQAPALPPVDKGTRPPSSGNSSSTRNIDPCLFASESQLKPLIVMGLNQVFPVRYSKNGKHVTIKAPRLIEVNCPDLNVSVRNMIRYKKTRGVPQYSTRGKLRFAAELVAQLNLRRGAAEPIQASDVRSASACMTGLKVTRLDLRRIPNWLDNTWVRNRLNKDLNGKLCVDVTPYVKYFLEQGGGLGNNSAAVVRPKSPLKPRLINPEHSPKPRMSAAGQGPGPKIKGFFTPADPEPLSYTCNGSRCYCKKGQDCDDLVADGMCKKEDLWCDPMTGGRTCTCKPTAQTSD